MSSAAVLHFIQHPNQGQQIIAWTFEKFIKGMHFLVIKKIIILAFFLKYQWINSEF